MDQDKRQRRELKRELKRAGNKQLRQQLKRVLAEDPEKAAEFEPNFGPFETSPLNGQDRDFTRRNRTE